jgi:hypothetical protein
MRRDNNVLDGGYPHLNEIDDTSAQIFHAISFPILPDICQTEGENENCGCSPDIGKAKIRTSKSYNEI